MYDIEDLKAKIAKIEKRFSVNVDDHTETAFLKAIEKFRETDEYYVFDEFRDTWLRNLRNKKFKQGTGKLKITNSYFDSNDGPAREVSKYCCLGVAREVCPIVSKHKSKSVNYLSKKILPMGIQKGLADLNDKGIPFPTIANLIGMI